VFSSAWKKTRCDTRGICAYLKNNLKLQDLTAVSIQITIFKDVMPYSSAVVYQSQSYFMTCGLAPINSSWRQAPRDSRPVTVFFFQLNTCVQSPYVTSSLARGWVCHLQLLLVLASAVILMSRVPRNSWPPSTVSDSRLPHLGGPRSPYLYPPGMGWPSYNPRHWFPFSSFPTPRGATVEVFDPVSTRLVVYRRFGGMLYPIFWTVD
jgi:hypothetical protein